MTEVASVPGIDKAAVQARLGSLQRLGSRAPLVTVWIAEATAALALIVPAETTSTSRLVLVVWNILLLAALVFWRRTSDSMRRCFLYLVMSVMAVRWSVAWLGSDLTDTHIAVVAMDLGLLVIVSWWVQEREEFVVWAHDLTDVQAEDLVVRIRRAIATHVEGVTASIGWTVWRAESENWTDALGRADTG